MTLSYDECAGVTYDEVHRDPTAALDRIVERYHHVADQCDAVVIVGSDYTDVSAPTEFSFNARIAANLSAPVLLVLNGSGRSPADLRAMTSMAAGELKAQHGTLFAVVANRVDEATVIEDAEAITVPGVLAYALPEEPILSAPSVADLMAACDGTLVSGDASLLAREATGFVVAAMTLPHVLDRLFEGAVVITPGDRPEIVLGVLTAHVSATFPQISGIVLNGGIPLAPQVARLLEGIGATMPIVATDLGTHATTSALNAVRGRLTRGSARKVATAQALFDAHVDGDALLDRLLGQGVGQYPGDRDRLDVLDHRRLVDPVGDHREQRAVLGLELADGHGRHRPEVGGAAPRPVEHEQHRRAEVGRDAGVDRELGGRADVGVVAAHDHDRVAAVGHLVVALDDPVEGRGGVAVHVVVGDAGALVVRQGHGVVGDQQVQDVVAAGVLGDVGAHHRAEHPDPADAAGELLEQSQRDGRLAGVTLEGGDVHAAAHGPDPSRAGPTVRAEGRRSAPQVPPAGRRLRRRSLSLLRHDPELRVPLEPAAPAPGQGPQVDRAEEGLVETHLAVTALAGVARHDEAPLAREGSVPLVDCDQSPEFRFPVKSPEISACPLP